MTPHAALRRADSRRARRWRCRRSATEQAARLPRPAREVEPDVQPHGDPRAAADGHASPARRARRAAALAGARGRARSTSAAGAGLPGIPLAIARPARRVTLLDASHKKGAFLRQAVIELGLRNVDGACRPRRGLAAGRALRRGHLARFRDLADFVARLPASCRAGGRARRDEGRRIPPTSSRSCRPDCDCQRRAAAARCPGSTRERHLVLCRVGA